MAAFLQQTLTILMYVVTGAVIGYTTNVVAVKLLFHPQKPIKIGPFKIQGLIPTRIEDLGERFTNILSKDLTKRVLVEALREALSKGLVKDIVEESIDRKLRETLARIHPVIPVLIDTRGFARQIASLVEQVVVEGDNEREIARIASHIVDRIDLAKHARQALESMDSRELESMFREIAGKELRFVEISGALLGSLIGAVNGVLALLLAARLTG